MCTKTLITTIIFYLCFDESLQQHANIHGIIAKTSLSADNHWDFLRFVQSWPESVCKVWTHKKPNHHCVFPKSETWTIHGIWPSVPKGMGPFNCNSTWLFDPEKVRPIETELEQDWTNVEKETPLYSLWAHEWNKHGTCAAMIEPLNNEFKYFSKGIEYLKEYNMSRILRDANIIPSNTTEYKAEDINKVIAMKIGLRPVVKCEFEDKKQYIKEIHICFDKNLKLIECLGDREVNGLLTTCDINKGILYPMWQSFERQPKSLLKMCVDLYETGFFTRWIAKNEFVCFAGRRLAEPANSI